MKALRHNETDPGRMRLQRGHRRLGKRLWDESLQNHIEGAIGEYVPWEGAAQDRTWWKGQEVHFVARISRKLVGNAQLLAVPLAEGECI